MESETNIRNHPGASSMEQPFPGIGLVVGAAREIPEEWNLCSCSGNSASVYLTCLHPSEELQVSLGVQVWSVLSLAKAGVASWGVDGDCRDQRQPVQDP